uniref:Seven TM Receptor n=1 Tax=Caenorhabditis japonica TaxID=281687 RepID=A0A8R1E0B2_CAEJA
MNPSAFDTIKNAVQVSSVILSWVINLFLIYLIVNKSNKKMGNYRHLMVFFCICSFCFSTMDVAIRPIIYSHQSAFFMMMDLRNRAIPVHVANAMVCVMAGCFGVIIYGIAIHFIFRYFALESEAVKSAFDINITETAYAAAIFYPPDHLGHPIFNYQCFLGSTMYLLIMIIPFAIVVVICIKSVRKIRQFPMSKYGKDFQMQLYKALIAQTLIPVIFLFIPFGVLFVLPIFEISCKTLSTSLTFVYALYPVVDPLPIMFFVDSYRRVISKFITWKPCFPNKVNTVSEEVQSREESFC